MAPPDHHPITGLCIVSDPEKCPPQYELIYKSADKRDDCDLWKDGFFSSKVTRYLCVTRVYPLDSGKLNNVLGDIVLMNEREQPYTGFCLIDKTVDSSELATKKKVVCVKMLPRNSTSDAITDIVFLSKSKRAPAGYTLVGEINGLMLCYKMGRVPLDTQKIEPQTAARQNRPKKEENNSRNSTPNDVAAPSVNNAMQSRPSFDRQESLVGGHEGAPTNALHDVPFVLGPKYQGMLQMQDFSSPTLNFRSLSEIESEYDYTFRLERQAAQQSL